MHEAVMQNAVKNSTRESTEIILKIIYIIYAREDIEQVADSAFQMKYEEIDMLLSILN